MTQLSGGKCEPDLLYIKDFIKRDSKSGVWTFLFGINLKEVMVHRFSCDVAALAPVVHFTDEANGRRGRSEC